MSKKNNVDIDIKQLQKQEFKDLQSSQLVLEFSGSTVNCCMVNTLRRLCIDHIPTYAASFDSITIDKNTSVFDNDYMKLRLSQLTIPNIKINIPYLEDKYWKDINFSDPNRTKHPKDDNIIELYVNITNEGTTNLNVTTNHAKVYMNGDEVEKFDEKYPLLLIQLKPNESFSCRCVHVLAIGKLSNLWTGGNIYYNEINDNNYILTLESQGQMDEYELLHKACIVLKEKNDVIRSKIQNMSTTEKYLTIELWDEDSTMGELINTYLQNHKDVTFAGGSLPNMQIDMYKITYVTSASDPLKPFHEILDLIDIIASNLLEKFEKLGHKHISYNKK
jgi:DNA-directed RNA polymerase subunit L